MNKSLKKLGDALARLEKAPSPSLNDKNAVKKAFSEVEKLIVDQEKNQAKNNKRISEILDVVINIAKFDYSVKAKISNKGDHFDALASGINMLGEELQSSTVSLREKEVLLREIHHRVKNNLQMISSLLSLQSAFISDPYSLEKFTESRNRIRSMAMVHEKLYLGRDLSRIDMTEYINSLVNYLNTSYNLDEKKISVSVNILISDRLFNIDEAIPCGLIINELITNSFKHAFLKKKEGKIQVVFKQRKAKGNLISYTLEISDNGSGLSEAINVLDTPTLGLQLVALLTEQLEGKLIISREKGTSFLITFAVPRES
jgi:two-component sensor histidine kinase